MAANGQIHFCLVIELSLDDFDFSLTFLTFLRSDSVGNDSSSINKSGI